MDSVFVLNALRGALSDLNASGRWSNAALIGFIDRANKTLVGEVRYPDSRVRQPSVAGVQLYQEPLFLEHSAVYIAGQLIDPSSLATMEGRQLNRLDSSGDGSQLPPPYGDSPGGQTNQGGGVAAPAWTVEQPLSYPDTNGQWVTPKPDAQTWFTGSYPRYYWRGGWIGFTPPIGQSGASIEVDGVLYPQTIPYELNGNGQMIAVTLASPDNFLEALLQLSAYNALFADIKGNPGLGQAMEACDKGYTREKRKLISWLGRHKESELYGPKPMVMRTAYRWYSKRSSRGGYWYK